MIRTTIIVSAFLLTINSIAHAEDQGLSYIEPGIKPFEFGFQHQSFYKIDMNISPREYEDVYSHNRRFMHKTLKSYSKNVPELIGIPEQGGYLMGAALGLVVNDVSKLALNKSETLALEFNDMDKSERALILRVTLDW